MESPDYDKKIWGTSKVELALWYLQALKLRCCLQDLKIMQNQVPAGTWRPIRLLDVGCGGGGITKAIKHYHPDLEVFGGDVSQKAVDIANRNPQGVAFSVCKAERLPFENNYFDALTLFDVLEHVESPKQILTEAHRVLRKGGILHLSSPLEGQPGTLYWVLGKLGWQRKKQLAGHLHQFSAQSLSGLIEAAGFQVIKKRYSFHLLGQLLDIAFYTFLAARLKTGFEEHLEKKDWFPRFWKNALVTFANLESTILYWLPGGGVQMTCKTKDQNSKRI